MTKLVADRRPFTGRGDGISSEGDHDRARCRHGGAT